MKLDPRSVEYKEALDAAWERLRDFPEPPSGERDREAEIVMEVCKAMGTNDHSVDLRLTWASWVCMGILVGNGDGFKRMAKYVEGLRTKASDGKSGCLLPCNVILPKSLLPKGKRGAPKALGREDSNLRLFAKAAISHVESAQLSIWLRVFKLLSAKEIEDDFNKLRREAHPGSSDVPASEFSRCVKAWDLAPLLHYERSKPGPKKGARQFLRSKSSIPLRKKAQKKENTSK